VVDKPWVKGWLWGLVANDQVDIRRECPMGAAVVETEQSFANGLVSAVTLGIYTPQHVRITCASRSAMLPSGIRQIQIPDGATKEAESALIRAAIETSAESHAPVALRF
jgi:Bor protein